MPRVRKVWGSLREFHQQDIHPRVYRDQLRVPHGGGFTAVAGDSTSLREVIATGEILKIHIGPHRPESLRHKRGSLAASEAWDLVEGRITVTELQEKRAAAAGKTAQTHS